MIDLSGNDSAYVAIFYVVLIVVVLVVVFYFVIAVKVIRHAEVMIIERFGRYKNTLKPGLHFIIPFIDSPRRIHWRYIDVTPGLDNVRVINIETDRIDMREHVIDFGRQHVITKDTVQIDIDALVYYQITDPELAVFKIQNLPDSIELLTQTTLRNIIAQMTLDDTFSSRELINAELKEKTMTDAERWGVSIKRVEIMNILPPSDIKQAMEKQIREERERRSHVLQADGERESAIIRSKGNAAKLVLEAEGEKTANIQRSKGQAEAKLLLATAEAESIKSIKLSLKNSGLRATDYLITLQYLNALKYMNSSGKPTKVILVPSQTLDTIGDIMKMPHGETK